jgi:SAM-dependent methyltransferase
LLQQGRVPNSEGKNSSAYTELDLHLFGLLIGARTVPIAPIDGLKSLVLPVEYIRCIETRYVLQHLGIHHGQRILDIGSPKLLSLFVATKFRVEVHATDLADYFFRQYDHYSGIALSADRWRYQMRREDARQLSYSSDYFDRVFSISAIEHIPDDGDTAAIKEVARVLAPGGVGCFTVPWSDRGYKEDFKRRGDPDIYWAPEGPEWVFFQRAYDRETLEQRLLRPSGLSLVNLSFWGERRFPVERLILNRRIPRSVRILLYPAHLALARLFLRPLTETEPSRKKVACFTVRKAEA